MPENITSRIITNKLLKQQQLEIIGKFLLTDSRYKESLNLLKKHNFLVLSFQKIQNSQNYIFSLHQVKKFVHDANLRNKIWQIILILHRLGF